MKPSDLLKHARAKIVHPADWCQGYAALDALGYPTDPNSIFARRWCAMGALDTAPARQDTPRYREAQDCLNWGAMKVRPPSGISGLNDNGTHDDVIRMYDHAIKIALQREAD